MNVLRIFALLCLIFELSSAIATISLDLGSEYMKVAIVKRGVPMEIVLNKESKRKTPIAIAFKDGDRLFGDPALAKCGWSPNTCYTQFVDLLGKDENHPVVEKFRQRFPWHDLVTDEDTNRLAFKQTNGTLITIEQLVAMEIRYARKLAEDYAGETIKDMVITVPPYYTQAERLSMIVSAKIAGINLLQLMNDATAAALNYAVFRRSEFTKDAVNVMIYDMGATGTSAAVVSFQVVNMKDPATGILKDSPQLSVRGIGFNRNLGGYDFEEVIVNYLKDEFEKKHDLTLNKKAILKLWKEAKRVKEVLSANNEYPAQVEGLQNDIDMKTVITRELFEKMISQQIAQASKVAKTALQASNLLINDLQHVIVIGGAVRVPAIQQALKTDLGVEDLAKLLNGDEAVAMGAVYQAAHLASGFRVQFIDVRDSNLYPIDVKFPSTAAKDAKISRKTLYPVANLIPQRKQLSFPRHKSNFDIELSYNVSDPELLYYNLLQADKRQFGSSEDLFTLKLQNVSQVFEKYEDMMKNEEASIEGEEVLPRAASKGIKAHFRMTEDGVLDINAIEAIFSVKEEIGVRKKISTAKSIGDSIKNTLGNIFDSIKGGDEEEKAEESTNNTDSSSNPTSNSTLKNETLEGVNNTSSNSTYETVLERKESEVKENINFTLVRNDWIIPRRNAVKNWTKLLDALDKKDKDKFDSEAARNSLESFLFSGSDALEQERFIQYSSIEERNAIKDLITKLTLQLEDEEEIQGAKEYEKMHREVQQLFDKVTFRLQELENRPKILADLNAIINATEYFYNMTVDLPEENQIYTEKQLGDLKKVLDETMEWRDLKLKQQEQLTEKDDPKILTSDVVEKMKALERETKYLINKAKYAAKKRKEEAEKKAKQEEEMQNSSEEFDETQEEAPPTDEPNTEDEDENQSVPEQEHEHMPDDEL